MRFYYNRRLYIYALQCLLFATFFILGAGFLRAAEPDSRLYSNNVNERFSAYQDKTQQLNEALAVAMNEKSRKQIILQQDLLAKLKEFSNNSKQPMPDFGLPDSTGKSSFTWQHLDLYLERYADIMIEIKKSASDIGIANGQFEELYNKLIALDQEHPDIPILQLQYAIQAIKLDHQKEVDGYLKDVLKKAKDEYSRIIQRTITVYRQRIEEQERVVNQTAKRIEQSEETAREESTGTNVKVQKLESLLAGYLGQELSDTEKKTMHFEQLKLLNLQLEQVSTVNQTLKVRIDSLVEQQVLIWFRLLSSDPEFFQLSDMSGDLKNILLSLREQFVHQQELTHAYEKDVSSLGGGNALLGPKAQELLTSLNQKVQRVFEQLSGMDQQGEMLENKAVLLERTINLKQSALGSVVTKTKVATDDIYEKILSVLRYPLLSYNGINISLLLMLQLLSLLAIGIVINRAYCHMIIRLGKKRKWTEKTIHLVQAVGKYPFIFLVAMIILSVVGINTRSLALVAGALSVGVGFGMQTIANNLVSGIILLFDKSISPGDFISLGDGLQKGGTRGNVVQMNIRATVLRTNDNINIIIPNADLIASQVVNWTYSDDKIRLRIPFSVAYGTNINRVKALVEEAVIDLPIVLSKPKPQIWLDKQTGHSLQYLATIWVEGQNARQPARTTDTVLSAILAALYSHSIAIPNQAVEGNFQEYKYEHLAGAVDSNQTGVRLSRQIATQ
jgi:potassium efflux system protein